MEVDISDKVRPVVKYGFFVLLAAALFCAGIAWLYQSHHRTLPIAEAEVVGNIVQARARAAGTVTELLAQDGELVQQGQVLARLKVRVSEEQIRQLEENLALSQRNLEEIRAGITTVQPVYSGGGAGEGDEAAREKYERMERLFQMGAVSARERDAAEAAYEATRSRSPGAVSYQTVTVAGSPAAIKAAEIRVRQAEAALRTARQDAAGVELLAPVAGMVYLSDVGEGSEVKPGQPVLGIGDTESLWLEAYTDPDRREQFYVGQAVSYTLDGKEMAGSVTEIVEPSQETETAARGTEGLRPENPHEGRLVLRISLPVQEESSLRPAMRTTARVFLGRAG